MQKVEQNIHPGLALTCLSGTSHPIVIEWFARSVIIIQNKELFILLSFNLVNY